MLQTWKWTRHLTRRKQQTTPGRKGCLIADQEMVGGHKKDLSKDDGLRLWNHVV